MSYEPRGDYGGDKGGGQGQDGQVKVRGRSMFYHCRWFTIDEVD